MSGLHHGWCVIVDTQPYDAFPAAAASAARARAAGFPDAGVYDPRDFVTLAWGALAVIAAGDFPTAKDAAPAVKKLTKAHLDAYAKPCTAATPAGAAMPIDSAAHVAPLPKEPSGPVVRLAPNQPHGCFAWSASAKSAACITGRASNQTGEDWSVDLLGTSEQTLDAKIAKAIDDALAQGKYARLDVPSQAIRPDATVDWVEPRLSVTWARKGLGIVDAGDGSWPQFDDTISIRCGGRDQAYVQVFHETSDNTRDPSGRVTVIPGAHIVLVEASWSYGIEGEHGAFTDAAQIDLDDCQTR
jgi:hypothetical protein